MDQKQKKILGITLIVFGVVIVALCIFKAGMIVGFQKASYIENFGQRYYETFGGPRMGMGRGMMGDNTPGGHGVTGKVVKIELPNVIVESPDNIEKIVVIDEKTQVRSLRESLTTKDIKVDDRIVVLGSPDEKGQIVAKLIRIFPTK